MSDQSIYRVIDAQGRIVWQSDHDTSTLTAARRIKRNLDAVTANGPHRIVRAPLPRLWTGVR